MTMIWCSSSDEEEYTRANINSKQWFESDISFADCEPVDGAFPEVTLEIVTLHPPSDYLEPGSMFVVSDRLKSVLEEFPVRAEFFPVRIMYRGQEYQEQAFYYCNIMDCVDCFDRTRGEYTFWDKPGFTDRVKVISKLAIDEENAAGHDLFRITKGGEILVCTSDRLAARVAAHKFRNVVFVKPEDWRFGM